MTTRRGGQGHLVVLTAAQTAGQGGTWAAYVAALPAALTQPHPAVAVSWIAAAWGAPSILAYPAGRIADRYGPHLTGATAWALAAAAATVPVVTRPGLPGLLAVLAVLALGGTWGVAAGEAAPTWLPGLADPSDGGPWLTAATNLALTLGPLATSSMLTYAGDRAAWALVAGLSAAAALATLLTPARPPEPIPPGQQQTRMPPVVHRALALTAGVYLVLGAITICEPLYVGRVLHDPLAVYGQLLATTGAAGLLTALAAHRWPALVTGRRAIPAATVTLAAGTALYIDTPVLACAFTGAAVFGTGTALTRMSVRAVIVRALPGGVHGRTLGLWETVQNGGSVLPASCTGTLVSVLGLRAVLAACSTLAGAVAAASLWTARTASGNHAAGRLPPGPGQVAYEPTADRGRRQDLARWPFPVPASTVPPGLGPLDPARFKLPQPTGPAVTDRSTPGGPRHD